MKMACGLFLATKKIESLADLKGMKMRVPQAPISIAIFNALGANATPVAFNELYSALQQGVVDGQENGYPTFTSNRYYEVQKYIAESYHMWSINELFVSDVFWQKLTPELQEIVQTACEESGVYQRNSIERCRTAVSRKPLTTVWRSPIRI